MRFRHAISKRNFSSSRVWEMSVALAVSRAAFLASRAAVRSRIRRLRASTSFGRSAASDVLHYNSLGSTKREQNTGKQSLFYTASCGSAVRTGRLQSIPSSNIDNCAPLSTTVPEVACGHTK